MTGTRGLLITPFRAGTHGGAQLRTRQTVLALTRSVELDIILLPTILDFVPDFSADEVRSAVLSSLPPESAARVRSIWLAPWVEPVWGRKASISSLLGLPMSPDLAEVRREVMARAADVQFIWCFRGFAINVVARSLWKRTIVDLDDILSTRCWAEGRVGFALVHMAMEFLLPRWTAGALAASDSRWYRRALPAIGRLPNTYPDPLPPVPRASSLPRRLLFVGALGYAPNRVAAKRLVASIGPRVRARSREPVQVRIVGSDPRDLQTAHDGEHTVVTGLVPDLRDELAQAAMIVVPLVTGAGTRLKVLEAFACRIPVVATPIAVEGLDAQPGIHYLAGTTDEQLAAACLQLLDDEALAGALVEAGRRLYDSQFSEEIFAQRVHDALGRRGIRSPRSVPLSEPQEG